MKLHDWKVFNGFWFFENSNTKFLRKRKYRAEIFELIKTEYNIYIKFEFYTFHAIKTKYYITSSSASLRTRKKKENSHQNFSPHIHSVYFDLNPTLSYHEIRKVGEKNRSPEATKFYCRRRLYSSFYIFLDVVVKKNFPATSTSLIDENN